MIASSNSRLFEQAFDTFKAFDNLTVVSSSAEQQAFPASIWQILQHLLVWQEHQLIQLQGETITEPFDERRSWNFEHAPANNEALQVAVTRFKEQLAQLQTHANQTKENAQEAVEQGMILQEVVLHLSFHLGEVVLMRRLQGSYPLPAHMQAFLQE